ncbi:MAG: response regulator transcription factor [Methylococcales bacterium]
MNDIHVVLVEDEDPLRDSLSELLELSGILVDGARTAIEFYQLINTVRFDVALIDIGLPDQSGLKIVEFLRKNTTMGIILLTARGAIADRIKGYNCGADHFFVKPVDSKELIAAIKSLHTRLITNTSKNENNVDNWCLDKISWKLICPEGLAVKMTSKEMLFMQIVMAQAGQNISRETLMECLKYPLNEYGSRSMDSMLRRLRKKCEEKLLKTLPIQTVRTVGYCFSSPAIILDGH